MVVHCKVESDYVEHEDSGREVEGTVATCERCGHVTKAYGSSNGSRKRCLVLMREQCPKGESNYYMEAIHN